MLLAENITESYRAVRANLLRTNLTSLIIAIGIAALVGILTAVESLKSSINTSFSSLGSNTMEIRNRWDMGGHHVRKQGKSKKRYPVITYKEAMNFKGNYKQPSLINIMVELTETATLKSFYAKSNPNIAVEGSDENYLLTKKFNIPYGRNFSNQELVQGNNVAIIGSEIAATMFPTGIGVGSTISLLDRNYKVIGQLEPKGSTMFGAGDRFVLIPLENAYKINTDKRTSYDINVTVQDATQIDVAMNEALGLMRLIRKDGTNQENSFEITKSDSLAEALTESLGTVTIAASLIGFITLLGAAIGLMNIMLVSVTERTREIGVRKAIGASAGMVRTQFLVEAVLICQIGGIVGIILGILFGNIVSYFLGGDFVIPWKWIFSGLTLCFIVGIGSGFYPAWKASKLDPIDALRYE